MTCGIAGVQSVSADDKKTLKVAMECGYAPYNWTQPDDSNGAVQISGSSDYAYGYDVMMAKKIADELGYDLEIVKLDWDSLVPAVQSGQVDCVIAGQSITKERQQMVDFTDPYYYASIITLVKNDEDYKDAASVEDLKGATVTSQQNTIWYDSCLPQIPDADILPAQESAPAMLVALESGKCDAVVTDMPTGKAACVAYPDFKLLDFSGTDGAFEVSDEDINIGISVQKGNDELKDAINGVLKDMTEDDYNKMMDEAISVQPLSES
ncbi:transporter substrate-binding domain-containing protein [Blautia obeum]